MEELQMEIRLEERDEDTAPLFAAQFIDPSQLNIENKFRFENLFDFPTGKTNAGPTCY